MSIVTRFAFATTLLVAGLTGTTTSSFAQIERLQNEASQNRETYVPPFDRSGPRFDRAERSHLIDRDLRELRGDRGRDDWRRDRDRREWRGDRDRRDWRADRDRREWRRDRDRRDYRRDRYWRGDRGPSIYFDYGPSYRYVEPRYVAPRYVAPRYVRPAPRRAIRLSAAHVNWCHARYRSYRSYDNTFQPYNGPRQQCFSPYS